MYDQDKGVDQNYQQAAYWYEKAAQEHENTSEMKDLIARNLTPRQLTEAQELAVKN